METKGLDLLRLSDSLGLDYEEVYERAMDMLNNRIHRGYYYEIYDRNVYLKKVEIDFTPDSTDVALLYTFEVVDNG